MTALVAQSRVVSTLPQRVDLYFERRPLRRYMCARSTRDSAACTAEPRARRWCGISGFSGFYVANTVSLSFGALAVNDIVAAAVAVTFVELATRAFYEAWPNPCVQPRSGLAVQRSRVRARRPFSLWLLHCFKARVASGVRNGACTDATTRRAQLGFVYALISDSFKLGG